LAQEAIASYIIARKIQHPNLMLFRAYIRSYLPSVQRLHIVEVNIQWWDTHVHYIVLHQTQWQSP